MQNLPVVTLRRVHTNAKQSVKKGTEAQESNAEICLIEFEEKFWGKISFLVNLSFFSFFSGITHF